MKITMKKSVKVDGKTKSRITIKANTGEIVEQIFCKSFRGPATVHLRKHHRQVYDRAVKRCVEIDGTLDNRLVRRIEPVKVFTWGTPINTTNTAIRAF